jgi:hypothetical protein
VAIFDHVREVLFLLTFCETAKRTLGIRAGSPLYESRREHAVAAAPLVLAGHAEHGDAVAHTASCTLGSSACGLNTGPRFRSGRGRTRGRQGDAGTCNGVRTCDEEWTWPCAKPLDIARKTTRVVRVLRDRRNGPRQVRIPLPAPHSIARLVCDCRGLRACRRVNRGTSGGRADPGVGGLRLQGLHESELRAAAQVRVSIRAPRGAVAELCLNRLDGLATPSGL